MTTGAVWSPTLCTTNLMHDNRERFSLGGAAHERDRGGARGGAAPVNEKRIGLNRSPRRQCYGR